MERIECSEVETIDEWCIFEWVSVDNAPFVGCSECVCVFVFGTQQIKPPKANTENAVWK